MNKIAVILFSSTSKSEETKLFVDINDIPLEIDILDFHYKINLNSNTIEKDNTYLNNNVFSVSSGDKSTAKAIEYTFSQGYKYVFYSHHDIFNLTSNAYNQIIDLCNSGNIDDFGLVGFNIYHDKEINNWNKNINQLCTTSKTFLQPGNGWWSTSPISTVNYKFFPKDIAFSVEIPHWACCILNAKSYSKINHKPIADFNLCLDDMAYDFLSENIHNICIPWISFAHQQSLSVIFGRAYKSPLNKKEAPRIKEAHLNWSKKWGFSISQFYSIKRSKFKVINHLLEIYREFIRCNIPIRYQNSFIVNDLKKKSLKNNKILKGLLKNYYKFNPQRGPLKKFYEIKK